MSRTRNSQKSSLDFTRLDERNLMAGISFSSSTGVLTVTGDQYADKVDIKFQGSDVKVELYAGKSDGTTRHYDRTKSISGVSQIVVNGMAGNDQVNITQGTLNTGVTVANESVVFNGGDGNDSTSNGTEARLFAYGGNGDDTFSGGSGADVLNGQAGVDRLYGQAGNDALYGGSENDLMYGGIGNDILYGEAGNDTMSGGFDNDWMDGGIGEDGLWGDWGLDVMYGNQGSDSLSGGFDDDTLYGGSENDNLKGEEGNDTLYGEAGNDVLDGGYHVDTLFGGDGNDWMIGGTENDALYGGNGNDVLTGNDGNDLLFGEDGEDQLYGGNGNDYLFGGFDGKLDYLVGGSGQDTFRAWRKKFVGGLIQNIETDWVGDLSAEDIKVTQWY